MVEAVKFAIQALVRGLACKGMAVHRLLLKSTAPSSMSWNWSGLRLAAEEHLVVCGQGLEACLFIVNVCAAASSESD